MLLGDGEGKVDIARRWASQGQNWRSSSVRMLLDVAVVGHRRCGTICQPHIQRSSSPALINCLSVENGLDMLFGKFTDQVPTFAIQNPSTKKV